MNSSLKRLGTVAVVGLLMLASFAIGTMVISSRAGTPVVWQQASPTLAPIPVSASSDEQTLANIFNRLSPSVVSINVISSLRDIQGHDGLNPEDFPEEFDEFAASSGTGFVIDTSGHIVTNAHVVDGATFIEVRFIDGTVTRGEIVGVDLASDLAVVRVDLPAERLQPATLGDSDALFIGQSTVAIGSPFGQDWTMTTGIISALNRTLQGLTMFSIGEVIQTDAAINPGNSGGPLLNLQGEVIGVNSQIISRTRSNSGIGFAIPSNLVRRVSAALIEKGVVDYSYIGIEGGELSLLQMEALNLPNNARGVLVGQVLSGSPADRGGLRSGDNVREVGGIQVYGSADLITAIDGIPLNNMSSLIAYLASETVPGQTVTLTVVRDGREQVDLSVTLGARPR
jgi:S1-C subfamily serine protease